MAAQSKNNNKSKKPELHNPNSDEQVKVLLKLLVRAKHRKLDSLGITWNDTDLGLGGYADFYDLPAKSLADMLKQLSVAVETSE